MTVGRRVVMLTLADDPRRDHRVRRCAETLAAAGHKVTLVAMKTAADPATERWEGYDVVFLPIAPFPLFPQEHLWRHLPRLARLRPDVVHAHEVHCSLWGWALARSTGARFVYETRESWPHFARVFPHLRWAVRRERWCAPRADLVITQGEMHSRALREIGARRPLAIRNIPADIDPRPPAAPPPWPAERAATYWGFMKQGRPPEAVLEAIGARPDLHLVLAGMGPRVPLILADPRLAGRVHHVGMLAPAELLGLGAVTAVAFCCIDHGLGVEDACLPNKLFEYARAGLPMIGSPLPEIRSFLETTGAGLAVDDRDATAVGRALDHVLADLPAFRVRAAAAGRACSWAEEARRLVRAYEML